MLNIQHYTMTSPERIIAMVNALLTIEKEAIVGDIVECGVWRGGNIILARALCPARVCWLYDTFVGGMTAPEKIDGAKAFGRREQYLATGGVSVDQVRKNIAKFNLLDDDLLRFIEGSVERTLKEKVPDHIALLRLDTDWYASTKIELEVLYPRLSSGGILIVDDYGHWPGSRAAVDEFFKDVVLTKIDNTAVMLVKQ